MGIRCPQCVREASADAKFGLDRGARIPLAKIIYPCSRKEILQSVLSALRVYADNHAHRAKTHQTVKPCIRED